MTTNAHTRQPDESATANLRPPARKGHAVVIGLWRFVRRNVPHLTKSGNTLCLPAGLAFFIGGTWDTGNGYAWTPPLWRMVNRYYAEEWHKAGYTFWSWIFQTQPPKRYVPKHGLWSSPNERTQP